MSKSEISEENVSIVIPTYNSARTIGNVIESLINQRYVNLEIIIVDDNSKDPTLDVINELKGKFPNSNIKIFKNTKNKGLSRSIREGLKRSSYHHVGIVHDDIYFPRDDLIYTGLSFLEKKDVACVSFLYFVPKEIFDKCNFWGKIYSNVDFRMEKKIRKIKEPTIGYNIAAGKAIIFKKMIIDELNLYNDKRLKYGGEDVDMYLKIRENNYKVVSIPFVYHAHANKTNSLFQFLKKEYYYGKIAGVISRIYGIKIGGGYGVLLKLGVYISLLIPKINLFGGVVLLIHYFRYTYKMSLRHFSKFSSFSI